MTNKEKFLKLVSNEESHVLAEIKERINNRAMLRESQKIALKVLMKLTELGWTQKDLAEKMKVSPQQITKIVSGKENLTIETQIKLQSILDIPILASYYEDKQLNNKILMTCKSEEKVVLFDTHLDTNQESQNTIIYKFQTTSISNLSFTDSMHYNV